jgi:hypothetical protein
MVTLKTSTWMNLVVHQPVNSQLIAISQFQQSPDVDGYQLYVPQHSATPLKERDSNNLAAHFQRSRGLNTSFVFTATSAIEDLACSVYIKPAQANR